VNAKDSSGKYTRSLGAEVFTKTRIKPADYQHAIDDLKATKFKRFTDNFIMMDSYPGLVDWFDPDWSIVAHNAACLARVAKQGGCKGIMLDPEMYGPLVPWSYLVMPEQLRKAHTYEQYRVKTRQRGREFIRAINKEFPDIVIFTLFGMSLPYEGIRNDRRAEMERTPYALIADFYDGILDAASPGTVLVDGYEFSYGYRTREQFVTGRDRILVRAKSISRNPKAFKEHVRAGFGVWADNNRSALGGFYPDDFSKNYFTPAGFRASVNYALDLSDRYVWIWSEALMWWSNPNAPKDFIDALRLARLGPGPGEPHPLPSWVGATKASALGGYADEPTFAAMRKTMTEIFDLPKDDWRFEFDKSNKGARKGWYRDGFDDSGWRTISIGKFWEEQVGDYDGRAWYRRQFTAPAVEPGKRVFIAFGATDDAARIWLNGQFVGERDNPMLGWDQPYSMEVTHILRPGQKNLLAVQVIDRGGFGGIWKSVKLMER
jgi:hypothetical protein